MRAVAQSSDLINDISTRFTNGASHSTPTGSQSPQNVRERPMRLQGFPNARAPPGSTEKGAGRDKDPNTRVMTPERRASGWPHDVSFIKRVIIRLEIRRREIAKEVTYVAVRGSDLGAAGSIRTVCDGLSCAARTVNFAGADHGTGGISSSVCKLVDSFVAEEGLARIQDSRINDNNAQ
jgi:hypothetical protein